ncbi:MAG: HAMP domain-containing protein, partial [Halomonadaceae bacterium]
MKASTSLAKRLRLSLIVLGVLNVIVMLVAVDMAYEDMKAGLMEVELKEERTVLQEVIRREGSLRAWNTANLTTAFMPDDASAQELPEVFQEVEIPYSGEVSHKGDLFLVTTERLRDPAGTLYLAQDITTLRDRERRFQLALVGIALLMLGLTFLFAHLGAAHLVRPLKRLTHQIRHITPGNFMPRLSTRYREAEYVDISLTFNRFLEALETHVQREKTMLAMAGHELRTP